MLRTATKCSSNSNSLNRLLQVALFIVVTASAVSRAGDRPNIVFLFADDQRADTIGAHGNPHIRTPHLDQLSRDGFSFRRNYCAGSFSGAVCVASRAMLMTGRYWKRIQSEPNAKTWGDLPLLPDILATEGGYQTFIVGKWHNGLTTLRKSFQAGRSVYMGGMADHTSFQVQDLSDGQLSAKRDAGGFSSEVFADAAIDFIEKDSGEQPYLLYVALMAPHDTRNPPKAYRQMYYDDRPPLPANFLPLHPFYNAPQATSGRDESLAAWPRTQDVISDQLCEYYGLITHLDEQVGRILTAVADSPNADNTYVVYTADHGLAMGSHGLLGKQNVYEQSMSCPLIVKGPGIPPGESTESFSFVHDLYATLCTFAGVDAPGGIDAVDLSPLWKGTTSVVHDSVYLPFQNNQRAVNDGRWKLHVYPVINHRLLFDLQADPHEMHDLANNPEHANEITRLTALMQRWRNQLGDEDPLSVPNPAPRQAQYSNENRYPDRWQPKWIRDKYFEGREYRGKRGRASTRR